MRAALPLDTDTLIATAVASRVAETVDGAVLGPAIGIGASGEHAGFPGTLSIGAEALELMIVELVRDATRDWPCVLLVNGHGGNVGSLGRAGARLADEGRRCRVWTASWRDGDAHAGRVETSLMLAIAPGSVRLDRAEPGDTRPLTLLMDDLRARGVRAVAPNGVLGDPAGASEGEGRAILAGMATACAAVLRELTGEPARPGPPS